jgi:hypothetical protein
MFFDFKMIISSSALFSALNKKDANENCFIAAESASFFDGIIIVPSVEYVGGVVSIE